jgi:hypothetical protein
MRIYSIGEALVHVEGWGTMPQDGNFQVQFSVGFLCSHIVRFELKVVTQYDRSFIDVILVYWLILQPGAFRINF